MTILQYYENLYKSQIKYDSQAQKTFLDKLDIPTISEEFAEMLEADLEGEEISIAIDGMKAEKSAGPDRILIDLYKKVKTKLLKPLLKNVNSVLFPFSS